MSIFQYLPEISLTNSYILYRKATAEDFAQDNEENSSMISFIYNNNTYIHT